MFSNIDETVCKTNTNTNTSHSDFEHNLASKV